MYHRLRTRPMSTPLMACPEGWVASPNASFSASCYYLSRPNSGEFTTSARGCTELHSHRRLAVSQVRRDLDFLAGRDKIQQAEFRRGLDRSLVQQDI